MLRWFSRRSKKSRGRSPGAGAGTRASNPAIKEGMAHLRQFAETRAGVEGFVEPPTTVTETTLLLVATTGEWTRRRVPDAAYAHDFANKLGVPSYDAAVVGYPQRMRDWNHQRRQADRQKGGAAEAGGVS